MFVDLGRVMHVYGIINGIDLMMIYSQWGDLITHHRQFQNSIWHLFY